MSATACKCSLPLHHGRLSKQPLENARAGDAVTSRLIRPATGRSARTLLRQGVKGPGGATAMVIRYQSACGVWGAMHHHVSLLHEGCQLTIRELGLT